MKRNEFIKQQYIALRTEILDTKKRIFKIIGFGIIGVPGAHYLAQIYQIDILIYTIPAIVIVIALIFLSENQALMRCGRYIRKFIENEYDDIKGWENWLEEPNDWEPRLVDKYVNYSFFILFFVYYSTSVLIAFKFSQITYSVTISSVLLSIYVSLGIWFLIFLIQNIRMATKTKIEP